MSRWTKIILSIAALSSVLGGLWSNRQAALKSRQETAVEAVTARAALTVAGTENPLPKKVPYGVQVSATVANRQSVVGEGRDAVEFRVSPPEIGQWAQVSPDGRTVQISTGMTKKLITIQAAVAKGDTVATSTQVVSVEPDGPTPTPEPDKPEPPDEPTPPPPTDKATEIYRLLSNHIKLTDELRKEAAAISKNFSDVAALVGRGLAGDPEAAAYTTPSAIVKAVVERNQTSVKDRSVWIDSMTALKQYTDELVGKNPDAAAYAELYPNVAKAFDMLSKPAAAQEKY